MLPDQYYMLPDQCRPVLHARPGRRYMAKHAAEQVTPVLRCHAARPSLPDMQQETIQAQPTAAEGLTR